MTKKEMESRLSQLPSGYISRKVINGKEYSYYQWKENGKLKSKYLRKSEVDHYSLLIEERKTLKNQLRNQSMELLGLEAIPEASDSASARLQAYNHYLLNGIIAIGEQDFDDLITHKHFYVDKTDFIRRWWDNGDEVTLITRPRRFGKTLTISMLECFFSNRFSDRADLFQNLNIWKDQRFHSLQGHFPLIRISFANVKWNSFEGMTGMMGFMLSELMASFRPLILNDRFSASEQGAFETRIRRLNEASHIPTIVGTISYLSRILYEYYGQKVLILIDEYDTPLQEAYTGGYWEEAVSLMRALFNTSLKSNPYMDRALMTGITRISKESLFSDMNNLAIYTNMSEEYADCFGFTEEEVFKALEAQSLGSYDMKQKVKAYYDGFTFGKHTDIYNPWSISCFLKRREFQTWWANTGSNDLIGTLFARGDADMKYKLWDLIDGKSISVEIDEDTVFSRLNYSPAAVWGLLLSAGYLTLAEPYESNSFDSPLRRYSLRATNLEVRHMLIDMIPKWFDGNEGTYNCFIKALMANDQELMNDYMNHFTNLVFSHFDTASGITAEQQPERFYHGFVLGLLAELWDDYIIRSNRESGKGRYDVSLIPRRLTDPQGIYHPAYLFEFKVFDSSKESSLEDTVARALAQIDQKHYDLDLLDLGIPASSIHKYGFAFQGKTVRIGS